MRPSSADKPATLLLKSRGLAILVLSLEDSILELANQLQGFHILISAVGANSQLAQMPLIEAAKLAGIQRFVPCAFISVCPPAGVMHLRDEKELIYNHILKHHLPFTIIDVGFWHQMSFPRLASGRSDYACLVPMEQIYGTGDTPTLLTDQRDIGEFVARIIKDERTLNKKVFTHSDELTQNQIYSIMESLSGETLVRNYVSLHNHISALIPAHAVRRSRRKISCPR